MNQIQTVSHKSIILSSTDGRVVRASACRALDLGLIPSRLKPRTLKLVLTDSLLDAQHQRDYVENKLTRLPVVPLGKALSRITPAWCGIQMVGNS